MGYRGEDVSRDRADSRRQQPWQQPPATRPAVEEQWSGAPRGYGQANDGYATGHDYPPDGSYPPGNEYASDGYTPGGYDGYGKADAYAGYEGYGQGDGYGYSGDSHGQDGGYGSGAGGQYAPGGEYEYGANGVEYGANGGYGQDYGYSDQRGYGEQPGYGQQGHGQSIPGYDDGNDWYGSQAPVTGGFAAVRDPVRGFPPAPGQFASRPQLPAAPPQLEAAPPSGLVHTGQHEVYDDSQYDVHTGQHEVYKDSQYDVYTGQHDVYTGQHEVYDDGQYETYPGYEGVTETDAPQGYDTAGYDTAGYDTEQSEPQQFAAAPTYEDAVGYAPQGYDDYDDVVRRYGDEDGDDDGTPGGGRPGKPGKPGKRRSLLSAVGIFLVVVAAAGAGYTFILKPKPSANNDSATGPLPSPGATSSVTAACQAKFGAYCHIEVRTDDPKPLTLTELYPPQFFNETDHVSFTQVGTRLDKNCANAVIGPDLATALQNGKCTQVLRASYVSGDQKIMGTIGVVNLNTTNEAHYAGKVVGANDFVSPLSAAHGIGKELGKGTGVVQAEFKGHYLILTWAEFSNLKAPANTAQDNALEQFENDLIAGTANISLSQRMINGTPATGS